MRCTSCGFPILPSNTATYCPRCGTRTNSSQNAAPTPAQSQFQPYSLPPQSEQVWLRGQVSQSEYLAGPPPQFTPQPASRNTKLGFIVAALCILTGGVILITVFFLASSLPEKNSSNSATTKSIPVASSTPTTAPTATAIPSTRVTVYPGQQYINQAQMSTAINPNNMQPTQLTTTFKTGQRIYVSFQLHPPGHNGAFCVNWYLNSRLIANFSLPVRAITTYSYAYAIYGATGPAYVELYWASTTQCSDQVLAQRVEFTVAN